jgi:hypothetical protein
MVDTGTRTGNAPESKALEKRREAKQNDAEKSDEHTN